MAKSSINIKALAKALNLSTSTVSRAFCNRAGINSKTQKLILNKAKELGYYPNVHASNLRDNKSNTIAVIMPELANNFFSLAVKGIERVAQANAYHTLIYVTDSLYEKEVAIVENLYNGRVDGIIMSVSGEGKNHGYIKRLQTSNIPLVFFDRVYDDIDLPKITTDDYFSSFKATEYLLKHGCKKAAFLVIDKNVSIGNARMNGFIDAHKKLKISADNYLIVDCSNDLDESYRIIKDALLKRKPDALLASVERLAIAAYRVCMDEKIAIPQQIKIISYSNLFVTDMLNPALSTIEQPAEALGTKAAEILFGILQHQPLAQKDFVLASKIIHRKSTEF